MPLYEYRCTDRERCGATHTAFRITWEERGTPERCDRCGGAAVPIFSAPRVQNLTASGDTLRTWGRDLRVERGVTDVEGLIRGRRERDAALAREGAPPPKAATMTTEEGQA